MVNSCSLKTNKINLLLRIVRNVVSWIRNFTIQIIVVVILLFGSDYFYTNHILVDDNPESLYRIKHDIYHHTLLPSFNSVGNWGGPSYKVCTDANGFKSDCNSVLSLDTGFDIAFIGDSFTEAVGMPYEDSFVGMYAKNHPNLKVANLGVSSYSPTIYRTKLLNFIERGYLFDHVIVFIDISDIQDESLYFRDSNGNVLQSANGSKSPSVFITKIKSYVAENFSLFTNFYLLTKQLFNEQPKTQVNEQPKTQVNEQPKTQVNEQPKTQVNEQTKTQARDVFNLKRSEWTYNSSSNAYGDLGVTGSIEKALLEMTLLSDLLEINGFKLSVGVYPWPAQISEMDRNNTETNLQVELWRKFCEERCVNFINIFPKYYSLIQKTSVEDVYQKYFIQGDVHYNREGNRLIYESLLKFNFK